MSPPAVLARQRSTTTNASLITRRYTIDKLSGRIVLKPLDNNATGRKRSNTTGTNKHNGESSQADLTSTAPCPSAIRNPMVKSGDHGAPVPKQTLLQASLARSSTKRKLSLSAILNDNRCEPLSKRQNAELPTAVTMKSAGKFLANMKATTIFQQPGTDSTGSQTPSTLSRNLRSAELDASQVQAGRSDHAHIPAVADPTCQTHACNGLPPQWRAPVMMSSADCSTTFGVVQSPTFMIGLPCGGMLEVANLYK